MNELRLFLGFCSSYWRFVVGFAKMVWPLTKLLWVEKAEEEQETSQKVHPTRGPRKSQGRLVRPIWTNFFQFKLGLTSAPILAYADPSKPYEQHVDTSTGGLGSVLYQEQNWLLSPVTYVSWSLTPSETIYPTHKLEFLALKCTIVGKLKEYLFGVHLR